MKKLFILTIIFLFIPFLAWAACTGSSPTWTCSSWSDLESCVEGSHTACSGFQDDDTITLNASVTANSTITITDPMRITGGGTCNDRDETADGCGEVAQPGGTWPVTITVSGGIDAFQISGDVATDEIIIGGFEFVGSCDDHAWAGGCINLSARNTSSEWQIHNIKFNNTSGRAIGSYKTNKGGLIYKCYILNGRSFRMHDTPAFNNSSGDYTLQLLTEEPNWGGSDFTFIEDCSFYATTSAAGSSQIDSSGGSKLVIRYNYFYNTWISSHGLTFGTGTPTLGWEVYENTFTGTGTANWPISFRSGTALVYDNDTNSSHYISSFIRFYVERSGNWGSPSTSNAWDGSGTGGDPYFGQPGSSQSSGSTFNISGNTSDILPLTLWPIYIWDNTGKTNISNGATTYLSEDTDYYSCTSSCVEGTDYPTGYSGYTYPHPWQSRSESDTISPAPPTGFHVITK